MQVAQELLFLFAGDIRQNDTNRQIAQYCLTHFKALDRSSITQLAGACHVSPATITRFCRALGYDDFLHFKDECRLSRLLFSSDHSGAAPFAGITPAAMPEALAQLGNGLKNSLSGVDTAQLHRLAAALMDTEDVLLLGIDFSSLMTLYLQTELNKHGKVVRVLRTTAHLEQVPVTDHTLLLLLCMQGHGLHFLSDALLRLREKSGAFWLVTATPALARQPFVTDALLAGAPCEEPYNHYVELAMVDLLLAACRELPPGRSL